MTIFANVSGTSNLDYIPATSTIETVIVGPEYKAGQFRFINELDEAPHDITSRDVELLRDVARRWHFPSVARQEEILDLADRLSKLLESQ